jgi:hypothetical protein
MGQGRQKLLNFVAAVMLGLAAICTGSHGSQERERERERVSFGLPARFLLFLSSSPPQNYSTSLPHSLFFPPIFLLFSPLLFLLSLFLSH